MYKQNSCSADISRSGNYSTYFFFIYEMTILVACEESTWNRDNDFLEKIGENRD